MSAVTNKTYRS